MSKTFRISSKSVYYAGLAINKTTKNQKKTSNQPPKNPIQRGVF
jgi:hypothetical protein